MNTTESFLRGKIAESISATESVPFTKKVSIVPVLTKGYITISPETESEEIFYYDGVTGTIGEAGTITITARGYDKEADTTDVGNQNAHVINTQFKGALNHIIINEKADKTDLASNTNGEGASTIGIEDAGGHYTSTEVEGALLELALGAPGVADASEIVAGKVEIATNTEAEDGTDIGDTGARLVVLPSQLVSATPDASDTVKGLSERATETEALAGTDDERFITPKYKTSQDVLYLSRDADSPTQTIDYAHSLGKTPKHIRIDYFDENTLPQGQIGMYDGTTQRCIHRDENDTIIETGFVIELTGSTFVEYSRGVIQSMDDTNISIAWTKFGSGVFDNQNPYIIMVTITG